MKELETFLKDTKHTLRLIEEINDRIDQGEFTLDGIGLVTLDIESMYNNITDDLGLSAARKYLNCRQEQDDINYTSRDPKVSTNSLMEGLKLCLDSNYFKFNEKIFKQKGGVGTGIKLAPPYACLAVGGFEEKAFKELSPAVKEAIVIWKRFIDDIFLLFRGSEEMCNQLVDWLNNIMPGIIKLKSNYSNECVEFLDLKIMIGNGKLLTDLYIKPTNLQLYLDYRSNHPEPCKNAIVYCQALRIVERCSLPELAVPHLEQLKSKFLERNYPENIVDMQIEKAKGKDRKQLIYQGRKGRKKNDKKVRLIFTNNEANPPIHKWLREGKKFLKTTKAKQMGENLQIVYKQPRNLQKIVSGCNKSKGRKQPVQGAGSNKCNGCRVACPVVKDTAVFRSTNTRKTYRIRQKMDCTSSFVIYLATCLRCQGQYVGKSETSFKQRHSNHKQEIKHKRGGIGKHFEGSRACSYRDIQFTLIEQVETGNKSLLSRREVWWQHQLRVYEENGGNAMCIRKEL